MNGIFNAYIQEWNRIMIYQIQRRTYIYTHTHTHTHIYIYIYCQYPNRQYPKALLMSHRASRSAIWLLCLWSSVGLIKINGKATIGNVRRYTYSVHFPCSTSILWIQRLLAWVYAQVCAKLFKTKRSLHSRLPYATYFWEPHWKRTCTLWWH